jgi:hypothetical protein
MLHLGAAWILHPRGTVLFSGEIRQRSKGRGERAIMQPRRL